MIGRQHFLGPGMVKCFSLSAVVVRGSAWLAPMAPATAAPALPRLDRNLSVTFGSDIGGLFAVGICLYRWLRALLAKAPGAPSGWLIFAAAAKAVFAASREEWLFRHSRDDTSDCLAALATVSCVDCGEETSVITVYTLAKSKGSIGLNRVQGWALRCAGTSANFARKGTIWLVWW